MNNTIYLILISILSILLIVTLLWLYCFCCCYVFEKKNNRNSLLENIEYIDNNLRETII